MNIISSDKQLTQKWHSIKKKLAFTLAEVLIVIGIIGIVAELTIPTLVADFQQKVLVAQLKQTYSILTQSYARALADNGEPKNWSVLWRNDIANILAQYLQTAKISAPAGNDSGASAAIYPIWNPLTDLTKSGSYAFYPQIQLKNGTILSFDHPGNVHSGITCSTPNEGDICFMIIADVNGVKKPNRFGVDVFGFEAKISSMIPFGHKMSQYDEGDTDLCDPTITNAWGNWGNGVGCTARVLLKENMDYLKCIDQGQSSYCHPYSTLN